MSDRYLIGYARVSTEDQDLRLQIDALTRYGVPQDRILEEKASGGRMDRKVLRNMLKALREGDRIVVWKLDRLGRSLKGVIEVVEKIHKAGADIVSITESIDTSTAMGRAFFHITLVFAQLERDMISERTKAGIRAKMLAEPDVKWGAKHAISEVPERLARLQKLYNDGRLELEPKINRKGERKGFKIKAGTGVRIAQIRDTLNGVRGERDIKSNATISRWLEDGVPGLRLRHAKPDREEGQ